MALPQAVRKQVEEANRLVAEMQSAKGGADERPVEPKGSPQEPPEPVAAAATDAPPPTEAQAPPVEAPLVAAAPPAEPVEDDFKHKYNVLRGKYDKEVPRLHRQVSELSGQLEGLRAVIADMQRPAPANPVPPSVRPLLSQEEIEEYGPDLIDVIGRKAREIYEPVVSDLTTQVKELKSQLGGVTQKVTSSDRDKVFATLEHEVKDWQTLNEDPEFLEWLEQADPYAGTSRGHLLRQAFEKNDARRVVAFFNGFLKEHAATQTTGGSVTTPTNGRPAVDLAQQIAPGRARATPPATTGARREERIWTRQEIAAFYDDCRRGKYASREKDRAAIERDIVKASTENRIR